MNIALVVAPGNSFTVLGEIKEYPSIFLLRSYLKKNNFEAECIDLNVELQEILSSEDGINVIIDHLRKQIVHLEKKEKLCSQELQEYLEMKSCSIIIQEAKNEIDKKKAIQKSIELLYRPEKPTETLSDENKWALEQLVLTKKLHKYQIVGLSIPFSTNYSQTIELAKIIKEKNQSAIIIIGGKFILDKIDEIEKLYKKGIINSYCIGDGEKAILQIIQSIQKGELLEGKLIGEKISIDEQINQSYLNSKKAAVYLSKGCFWNKCTFCSRFGISPHFEIKKINILLEEIEQLIHQGVETIELITDALPKNYAEKIANFLLEKKYKITWYSYYIRVHPVYSANLLVKLKKSGFEFSNMIVGVDGFTDAVLELEQKGYTMKEVKELFSNLREAKIKVRSINNIYDFPGVTFEEETEGFKLMEEYAEITRTYTHLSLAYTPHNEIAIRPEKFGVKIIPTAKPNVYGSNFEIVQEKGMTKEEKNQLLMRGEILNTQQNIIHQYHINPLFSKIKLFDPSKYDFRIKTRNTILEFTTCFDDEGNKIKPTKVIITTQKPAKISILKHQKIIQQLALKKEYSFQEFHEIAKSKITNKAIETQKTFRTIMDLAREEFFEEVKFSVK